MKKDHISYSQASLWMRCQYAYNLRYNKGLRPIREVDYLRSGSLVDAGLQAALETHTQSTDEQKILHGAEKAIVIEASAWLSQEHVQSYRREYPEEYTKLQLEAMDLTLSAVKVTLNAIAFLDLNRWATAKLDDHPTIQTELRTYANEDQDILGFLDWAPRRISDDSLVLTDFKVRRKRSSVESQQESLEDDWQLPLYAAMMREKGLPVSEVRHINIYGKPPARPKTNKNGSISKAACDTDWATYSDVVTAAGHDPRDYADMKDRLNANPRVTEVSRYISEEEERSALKNIRAVSEQIQYARKVSKTYARNITAVGCGMCAYQEYCRMSRQGHHAEGLIDVVYHIRKPGDKLDLAHLTPKVGD